MPLDMFLSLPPYLLLLLTTLTWIGEIDYATGHEWGNFLKSLWIPGVLTFATWQTLFRYAPKNYRERSKGDGHLRKQAELYELLRSETRGGKWEPEEHTNL